MNVRKEYPDFTIEHWNSFVKMFDSILLKSNSPLDNTTVIQSGSDSCHYVAETVCASLYITLTRFHLGNQQSNSLLPNIINLYSIDHLHEPSQRKINQLLEFINNTYTTDDLSLIFKKENMMNQIVYLLNTLEYTIDISTIKKIIDTAVYVEYYEFKTYHLYPDNIKALAVVSKIIPSYAEPLTSIYRIDDIQDGRNILNNLVNNIHVI